MFGPIDPTVPQTVLNAVIVAVMRDERHQQRWADAHAEHNTLYGGSDPYIYCNMFPVVHHAASFPTANQWGDLWLVEVQYSTHGARAVYGVNRDHVPTCYMN